MSRFINENVKRQLYAESMGKCMNPDCLNDLFQEGNDIGEKAHILPYSNSQDNSFYNLVILCPNCHTSYDKNNTFTKEVVKSWKTRRRQEISSIFCKTFKSFQELEDKVKPLLERNKTIYENYYSKDNLKLWEEFTPEIIINNEKIKLYLTENINLIQINKNEEHSNRKLVQDLNLHIDEFKKTRLEKDKIRGVLFPKEINSLFNVELNQTHIIPSCESLECLIKKLTDKKCKVLSHLGEEDPYIEISSNTKEKENLYLKDEVRLRQKYFIYKCFRSSGVRLDSLCFMFQWLKNNNIDYDFCEPFSLTKVSIKNKFFLFVYEYCLSKEKLQSIAPPSNLNIINLHTFNDEQCISQEGYDTAKSMGVNLFTTKSFYLYAHKELKNI